MGQLVYHRHQPEPFLNQCSFLLPLPSGKAPLTLSSVNSTLLAYLPGSFFPTAPNGQNHPNFRHDSFEIRSRHHCAILPELAMVFSPGVWFDVEAGTQDADLIKLKTSSVTGSVSAYSAPQGCQSLGMSLTVNPTAAWSTSILSTSYPKGL